MKLRLLFLFVVASAFSGALAHAGAWEDLLALRPIQYVLLETQEGRALSERILGRSLTQSTGQASDLAELSGKLAAGSDFRASVELRLAEVERRFEVSGGPIGAAAELGGVEQSFLRDLSRELISLDAGRVQFIAGEPSGLEGGRASFLAGGGRLGSYVQGYEATRVLALKPTLKLADFRPATGFSVVARDAQGNATEGLLRVLSDNPGNRIQAIGEFNDWGRAARPEDTLQPVAGSPYFEARITGLRHGMQYRLVLNGGQVLDPAAAMFTPEGNLNSVFWDFERPGAYRLKKPVVDLRDRHVVLGETDVRALVQKWPNAAGGAGPARTADTYRFIAESGVIPRLKRMGYNAIEFLPFNMSNDGEAWHYRYQVYGLFAPDSRYGTPEDFARMIDAFNQAGIGVVADVVVGHYPFEGNLGARRLGGVGPQMWFKPDGRRLFGGDLSPWGTYRYDYANPGVRRHLIDSIVSMVQRYGISGLRFDNLDGIRFCSGGTDFLRELHTELRAYRPELWTNAEMFFGDNSVTASMDQGGLGLNSRTNSDLFDWFKEHAQGRTEDLDMADLRRRLRAPLESWHEGSRVNYITSHDEAANGRGGFTGSYPANLLGTDPWWVQRRSEVYESLAMASGSATMDMPQARLLQRGDFSSNPAVDWGLRGDPRSAEADRFLSDLSRYVGGNRAFSFRYMSPEVENHTDYANKVISFYRTDGTKKIYVLINLSHNPIDNYEFGVNAPGGRLRLILDNDAVRYGGSGRLEQLAPTAQVRVEGARPLHGKPSTAVVPYLPAASVLVFEVP